MIQHAPLPKKKRPTALMVNRVFLDEIISGLSPIENGDILIVREYVSPLDNQTRFTREEITERKYAEGIKIGDKQKTVLYYANGKLYWLSDMSIEKKRVQDHLVNVFDTKDRITAYSVKGNKSR